MSEKRCIMWRSCQKRMDDGEEACRSCPEPRTIEAKPQADFGEVAAPVWFYPSVFC